MRFAQSGGPPAGEVAVEPPPSPAASPPTEPIVEEPPVASNAALPPASKLERMLSVAREAARRNGDTAALIPRFFRVSTEGTLDSYPSSAEITIRFQGAPANSLGQPDEASASAFTTNIATLNTTTFKFIRFQVEFDIQADGGSLSPATPLPALEFLRIPFRF